MIWFLIGAIVAGPAGFLLSSWWSERGSPSVAPSADTTSPKFGVERRSKATEAAALAQAVAALPIGLLVTNAKGEILYEQTDVLFQRAGRHAQSLIEGEARAVLSQALRGPVKRELDLYGPPRMFLELEGAPILDHSREVAGSTAVITDVTQRHQVETVRRDFVANVSHELKTPIGAIGVLAETLQESHDDDVVERLAAKLHKEAMRLGRTVDDLLVLSRIESRTALGAMHVQLDDVIADAVESVKSLAERHQVSLPAPIASGISVSGEPRQLISAFTNLLENAIRYSDAGAEVSVSVEQDDHATLVFVADQGIGIPEAELDRVFERFYRVDPARSRNTGGTGLGLSIVRHVMLNHGGDLSVTSVEGEGSVFRMEFPPSRDLEEPANNEGTTSG